MEVVKEFDFLNERLMKWITLLAPLLASAVYVIKEGAHFSIWRLIIVLLVGMLVQAWLVLFGAGIQFLAAGIVSGRENVHFKITNTAFISVDTLQSRGKALITVLVPVIVLIIFMDNLVKIVGWWFVDWPVIITMLLISLVPTFWLIGELLIARGRIFYQDNGDTGQILREKKDA